MPTLKNVVFVAAAAVLLGVLVVWLRGRGDGRDDATQAVPVVASGSRPAVHHFGTPEERARTVRRALEKLTSGQAPELGALKEDLALNVVDPAVLRTLLEAFHRRASLTKYEASAFAEIFALAKHPSFVDPVSRLLDHEEMIVRRNAIPAAGIQAHPDLASKLEREYDRIIAEFGGQGASTREEILLAASACGGDPLFGFLDKALSDSAGTVRATAASLVSAHRFAKLIPRLGLLLDDADAGVRLRAAWSLAELGDDRGKARLRAAIDPRDPGVMLAAIEAIVTLHFIDLVPELLAVRDSATTDVRPSLVVALVLLGERSTFDACLGAAKRTGENPLEIEIAFSGLAASGDPEVRPLLLEAVGRGTSAAVRGILRGLAATDGAPDETLLQALLRHPDVVHPRMVEPVVVRSGDGILDFLSSEIEATPSESRAQLLIACLGIVGTDKARDAVISAHKRWPALSEGQLRYFDLARRKRGQTS